jgi:vacuolar-type H+-ATPase subunit F/Vma7
LALRVVAVGGRAFVNSLRLAGAGGVVAETAEEAARSINRLVQDPEVGLIIVSDEYGEDFSRRLNEIRSRITMPIIYQMPAPGSRLGRVDYRAMLRQVLGI